MIVYGFLVYCTPISNGFSAGSVVEPSGESGGAPPLPVAGRLPSDGDEA